MWVESRAVQRKVDLSQVPQPLAFSIQAGTLSRKTGLVNDNGSHEFNNITPISLIHVGANHFDWQENVRYWEDFSPARQYYTFLAPLGWSTFWDFLAQRERESCLEAHFLLVSSSASASPTSALPPRSQIPNQPNLQSDFNQQHQHQVTSEKAPRWHMPGKTPQGGQEAQGPGLRWWTLWSPPWAGQTWVLRWTPSSSWTRVSFFLKSGDILTFWYLLQGRQRQL